jgi:hypothetical protein
MDLKVLLKITLMVLIWLTFLWLAFYISRLIIVTGTEWYKEPFIITTAIIMTISFVLILFYSLNKIIDS